MSGYFNTGELLRAYDIRPSKGLGQNFLNDKNVVQEIIYAAEVSKDDAVIEIGPGLGVMTEMLAEQGGCVTAVEIDTRLMPVLNALADRMGNIEIINKDILTLDINKDIIDTHIEPKGFTKVKAVANLPYYITTPIVMKFLEENVKNLDSLVFMVQKEVADRMVAGPGGKEYGAMSVTVGYFAEGKIALKVPPSAFTPRPGVDSAVVALKIRKVPPFELKSKEYFFKVVKASFAQRRKTLSNALANAPYIGVDRETVQQILGEMGLNPLIRGEVLTPAQFGELSNRLYDTRK